MRVAAISKGKGASTTPGNSPWGRLRDISPLASGIWIVRTEGHGGYYLEPEQNRAVPEDWKVATFANLGLAGWYKGDRDGCLVVLTFPHSFSQDERTRAKRTFEAWIAPKLIVAA